MKLAICCISMIPVLLHSQTALIQPYLQNATRQSIVVMWETNVDTSTQVQYGLTPSLGSLAYGTKLNTTANTVLHTVPLQNLLAGTTYYYRAKTGSWQSEIFDFNTPPLSSDEQSFNIVLMSDMQKDAGNPNIFNNLINTSLLPYIAETYGTPLRDNLQMALLPGDVVEHGNTYNEYKNDFFNPGQQLWRSVPAYPAIGNHEANSIHYFNYFNLPANGTPGYLEHWYSHDYSNVRVLSFDSNPTYRIPAQLAWLDSMLTVACSDTSIDFVFAQMHHPFKSELWVPGEADYTGEIVERLEAFSEDCGKPTIHFFGHTHAYSRGQSRDHQHLWVNVATSGGNIDYWGEFQNADYDEFIISQDEYGFVMVEVTAGADPSFTLRRLSFGDHYNPGGSQQTDLITVRLNNIAPATPIVLFPRNGDTTSAHCVTLRSDGFQDPDDDEHGSTHWQIATDSTAFNNPLFESWKQYANWYNEEDLQATDNLTDETFNNLPPGNTLWWRVRYRDKGLQWSAWSIPGRFNTQAADTLTANLVQNSGAESGTSSWTTTTGVIESLNPLECNGINPYAGQKYFAVGALCVEHPFASAQQLISVIDFAAAIDSGNIAVQYGGYLADWANTDEPSFALQFISENGDVIGGTDTTRHRQSAWTLKQQVVQVPINTRSIRFIIMGTRFSGVDNDSYMDQLFLYVLEDAFTCSAYQAPGPANGRIYVDPNAVGFPDGESWITAFRTVGDAIAQSNADTAIHAIWIADGVYPVTTSAQRTLSYHITRSIALYGGFAGGETSLAQRNPAANQTILSGEIGNPATAADNSYHVLRYTNTIDSNRLDGITICCGYADQPGHAQGGGLYYEVSNRELLTLHGCTMEDNIAMEGSSICNESKMTIAQSQVHDTRIMGITNSSVLNTGSLASLKLVSSQVTQTCTSCAPVIQNQLGATFIVEDASGLNQE